MREVRKHMEYEERTVFKYVDALLEGITHQRIIKSVHSQNTMTR